MAAARHALRDGCREHLASEEIGEALDRLPQCALVPQHDAIGDIEAGFPPQGVHVMGQLAREAFRLKLGRRVGDECGDRPRVTPDRVSRRSLVAHQYLGRREDEALDDRVSVARAEAPFRQRLAHARQMLPELRPE